MTINNSKITFIIPTIGRPSLKETIDSILSQTCQEWYVVIVFDGIEPNFAIHDDRIQIVQKLNSFEQSSPELDCIPPASRPEYFSTPETDKNKHQA